MQSTDRRTDFPWLFFVLTILLMLPFWLFGDRPLPLRVNLPLGALGFVVPVSAALIAARVTGGRRATGELLRRAWDYRRIPNKLWLLAALLLPLVFYLLAYLLMRAADRPLPQPEIPWLMAPIYLLLYLFTAAGEELGWTGAATDPLQRRWGALGGGLALGLYWATWHTIPWLQTHNPLVWIFWQALYSVLSRVLMFWIYNNSGKSLLAVMTMHAASNVGWSLFPNDGSHYDPFYTALWAGAALAVILILWEAKTLARLRWRRGKAI